MLNSLNKLGFTTAGYGCATCIGNSGPLPEEISKAINDNDLTVASVLSGNRNFEGRIHPDVKANYLASPPLVVAYAPPARSTSTLPRIPSATIPMAIRSISMTSGPPTKRSSRRWPRR